MIDARLEFQPFKLDLGTQTGKEIILLCRLGPRRRFLQRRVLLE
jgi:hypothetical protein